MGDVERVRERIDLSLASKHKVDGQSQVVPDVPIAASSGDPSKQRRQEQSRIQCSYFQGPYCREDPEKRKKVKDLG